MKRIPRLGQRAVLALAVLGVVLLLTPGTAQAAPAQLVPISETITYPAVGAVRVTGLAQVLPVDPYRVRLSLAAVVTIPGTAPRRCLGAGTDALTFPGSTTVDRSYRLVPPNPVIPTDPCLPLGSLTVSYALQFDGNGTLQAVTVTPVSPVIVVSSD